MRWLIRFGYDGATFAGWASQPGLRTVEGEIQRGLRRGGALPSGSRAGLDVASRTDRGVSARANAVVLSSGLPGPSFLRFLNGISPEIFFSAATAVDEGFRVRQVRSRTYRYFEPSPVGGAARWAKASECLVGKIDVRSFARRAGSREAVWRIVDSVAVYPIGPAAVVEIRAPSFVWGMVRKMISALRAYGAGRLTLGRLEAAARGSDRLSLPLAESERLILWEVEYGGGWEFLWRGPNRHQAAGNRTAAEAVWVRSQILSALRGEDAQASRERTPVPIAGTPRDV